MNVYDFGSQLLETGDLDPIYIMLHEGGLGPNTLKRWCLAYWCFYHAGVSSKIAEAPDFWAAMRQGQTDKWPRGTERRHFRGAASANAIEHLALLYPKPEDAVDDVSTYTFADVSKRVQRWPLFGPWIAYKVADMLERVLDVPVNFDNCELAIYREPAAAAAMLGMSVQDTVTRLIQYFAVERGFMAPPSRDRLVNVQEIETIMCKWKSHCGGHYPPGKDTREIRHGLNGWGPLADHLSQGLPNAH